MSRRLLMVSARHWNEDPRIAQVAIAAAAAGLLAATIGIFPGRRKIFLAGMAAGLLFVLVRG